MAITDELREYAKSSCGVMYSAYQVILAIANRIDAEHHAAIRELNNLADASVLLPVDADGEIIHVGDMMERGEARGHVIALMLSEYPKKWGRGLHWGVQLEGEQAPTALDAYFRHYHKPTVEDLLREFVSEFNRDDTELCDEEIIERFAAKLRLAESEES